MAPQRPVHFVTRPLYGILTTEKSNLLALRHLVQAYHASFLAHRVLGSRLPAELVDHIAEDIAALEYASMLQLWKALGHKKDYRSGFFDLPEHGRTAAEKAAFKEVALLKGGAPCMRIVVDRAGAGDVRYIHFSSRKNRPSLIEVVPGAASASGPTLRYAGGRLQVHCSPGTQSEYSKEQIQVWPSSKEIKVGKLVQVDGIEEAIKVWDQEAAEHYVKSLGLEVVSMNGEEEADMTPRLRLVQMIDWRT
jgi:hypothetical protein